MNILCLFLIYVAIVASVEPECSEYHEDDLRTLATAMKTFGFRELFTRFRNDPSKGHAVATLPTLCILANLAHHDDRRNYKRLLALLNMSNKREMKRIFMVANDVIDAYETHEQMDYYVFTDNIHPTTTMFRRNFANICGGLAQNIDFSNSSNAANYINQWFKSHSNYSRGLAADKSLFEKSGLVFANSFNFEVNFNHVNNPTGQGILDFITVDNEVLKMNGLFGNAFIEYTYNEVLDSKILKVWFRRDEYYGIYICPNNPRNLLRVAARLQDVEFFNRVVAGLKPMCAKIKLVIGSSHTVNRMDENLAQFGIRLNGYHDVYRNCTYEAEVNGIIEENHLTAVPINQRANINSIRCQRGNFPEIVINSPVLYHLMYRFGGPAVSGVFIGDTSGGNV